jgi:hypothetical protein
MMEKDFPGATDKKDPPPGARVKYVNDLSEGVKHDQGKARFDLLPPEALFELVQVFNFGAKEYGDRNWEKGLKWGRIFAAICRHIFNWLGGEENAKDSGLHHMAHAAWGCLALVTYAKRGMKQFDDRSKYIEHLRNKPDEPFD